MKRSTVSLENSTYFVLGFPLSDKARQAHGAAAVEAEAPEGTKTAPWARGFRLLADRVNTHLAAGQQPVAAGQLMAFGLLTEIFRYVTDRYCLREVPDALLRALADIRARQGAALVEKPARGFCELYPSQQILSGAVAKKAFLDASPEGIPNRYRVAREMILLHLSALNPAVTELRFMFDPADLAAETPYESLVEALERHFDALPPVKGRTQTLFAFLRAPLLASPHSIEGQIDFIVEQWADLLPAELLQRLQVATGVIREETRMRGHGPGPSEVLRFGQEVFQDWGYPEPAAFSADRDWMSNVVLIAKSTYVWLDQLSRRYQRTITRLDQVPDEELDRLARWGFTGLWLIGLWERSPASKEIKRRMGNPEALSSAYSLYDYDIAGDLGGAEAYGQLRDRAWQRGIRLASDMVPNHVGLYSRWVVQHPEWFLQTSEPPYPGYRFTGPDLSLDERVSLQVEDGYWNHSDAAVVFKRTDRWTGDTRYIYHGNDGTNMPWNDTAQLNFLIPEAREAVIQTILHVARLFPIIRFDAAMTLAKRHYQRLWFPKPGDEGAVPSRAEHSLSRDAFDAAFPKEFWREVVDRIQEEAPDTLLLAEAFWLMEGYFVRTLGMHRVYNSAFMNMLKMEENAKYRMTIKNVLEFSPEVLKRFVNFMNNPDERTAVEQFGKGDKYYGVSVMMVTMPGLPMFGHGQIEGFSEKYGMEYGRAYWDESVDEHMVWRHETEIFPLMRHRRLFSGSDNFALYDGVAPEGWVDENVFAYSNRVDGERALILYNNAYSTTRGTVRLSTGINVGDAENKNIVRRTLAEALALEPRGDAYWIFRDHRTKTEYIYSAGQLAQDGLAYELHAYEYRAFLDWREVRDSDGTWTRLCTSLNGAGVPSVDEAYRELILEPIHGPFRRIMNAAIVRALAGPCLAGLTPPAKGRSAAKRSQNSVLPDELHRPFQEAMSMFAEAVQRQSSIPVSAGDLALSTERELDTLYGFRTTVKRLRLAKRMEQFLLGPIPEQDTESLRFWRTPVALALTHQVARMYAAERYTGVGSTDDEWLLTKVVGEAFEELETGAADDGRSIARMNTLLVKVLMAHASLVDFYPRGGGAYALRKLFEDVAAQRYLLMNRYEGVLWVNKEQLETLIYWLLCESVISLSLAGRLTKELLATRYDNAADILANAAAANYQVDELFKRLEQEP